MLMVISWGNLCLFNLHTIDNLFLKTNYIGIMELNVVLLRTNDTDITEIKQCCKDINLYL